MKVEPIQENVKQMDATLKKKRFWEQMTSVRYPILAMTVICLSSIMANVVCFNFTVLCMPSTHEHLMPNHTTYIGYSKTDRTCLFSAVAVGALLAVIPVSHAIAVFGAKLVFVCAGFLTAVATALIPWAATNNLYYFLVLRFLQGISFASCMSTVGSVTSAWASLKQNGLFIATLTTFGQISAVFSMPVSGELCESSFGWESVYYLHSIVSVIAFSIFFFIYKDRPEDHSWVSKEELNEINFGKNAINLEENRDIPYLQILTTPSVWGIWIGALGDLVAVQLVHTFSPLYIRDVLQYSVHKTGFASAIPVLVQFFVKIFAGHTSDRIQGVSETTKLRIYNTIALGASAAFMIALAFVHQGQQILGVVLITLTTAMFGFNGGGFNKCATLVSRQHSHFVLANIQFIWCLSMLICPILVSLLLPTGAVSEWRTVYVAHAMLLLVANGVFCLLATAKPAPWTDSTIETTAVKNTPLFGTPNNSTPRDMNMAV